MEIYVDEQIELSESRMMKILKLEDSTDFEWIKDYKIFFKDRVALQVPQTQTLHEVLFI